MYIFVFGYLYTCVYTCAYVCTSLMYYMYTYATQNMYVYVSMHLCVYTPPWAAQALLLPRPQVGQGVPEALVAALLALPT